MLCWIKYDTPETEVAALLHSKGCYQTALLTNGEAWSGSTLRGKARRYGGVYARSRYSLINRLTAAGFTVEFVRGANNRKVAVISKRSELI